MTPEIFAVILRLFVLWLLGAGLLLVVVIVLWNRIGKLRDTLDSIRSLLLEAQGVNLLGEIQHLRADLRRDIEETERRLKPLEEAYVSERAEFLSTNQRVLRAMDALRMEWQQQREALITSVTAEARAVHDIDVRRIVRDEFFKLQKQEGR